MVERKDFFNQKETFVSHEINDINIYIFYFSFNMPSIELIKLE